jgi:hypothetical protein
MLNRMDDQHSASALHKRVSLGAPVTRPPQSPVRPIAASPAPNPPEPPAAVVAADDTMSTYNEHDQKIVFYARMIALGFVIVGILVIMGIAIAVSQAATTKMSNSKSSGTSNTTNQNEELLPSSSSGGTNPATGNASVGNEGAYCSNAINAALSC